MGLKPVVSQRSERNSSDITSSLCKLARYNILHQWCGHTHDIVFRLHVVPLLQINAQVENESYNKMRPAFR